MNYEIICEDSLKWLSEKEDNSLGSFLTGLPDMNEVSMNIEDYTIFFRKCAQLIFSKMSRKGYAIFIQTDRKTDGYWFDKSYHLSDVAYKQGLKLMWHKIVLQREVGKCYLQRPTYSHVLCYSYMNKPSKCFTDVLPVGTKMYENSTPNTASEACADFFKTVHSNQDIKIIDPFVGRGTTALSIINRNLSFIGIDIDEKQCQLCNEYLISNICKEQEKDKGKDKKEINTPISMPISISSDINVDKKTNKDKDKQLRFKLNFNKQTTN